MWTPKYNGVYLLTVWLSGTVWVYVIVYVCMYMYMLLLYVWICTYVKGSMYHLWRSIWVRACTGVCIYYVCMHTYVCRILTVFHQVSICNATCYCVAALLYQ